MEPTKWLKPSISAEDRARICPAFVRNNLSAFASADNLQSLGLLSSYAHHPPCGSAYPK
jgi:hypothetical protein